MYSCIILRRDKRITNNDFVYSNEPEMKVEEYIINLISRTIYNL